MKKNKKISFILVAILVLTGGLSGYKIVRAVGGQGTATIDGGANATVAQATSHKFTVVLSIGASGITADAQNPTFTIPTGFTAPNATPVANAGLVVANGDWSVSAAGGGCTVDNPAVGLTAASGQIITVDVTTTCTVAVPDTITLTYQGQSASAMSATALVIKTADDIGWGAVTAIPVSPTITVTSSSATLNVIKAVINDNGGTAVASAWTLTVASSNGGSGTGNAAGAGTPGTAYTLQVGKQYSVAESGGPSGYTASLSAGCSVASAVANTTYTCTITNDDIAPQLIVNKIVVNDNGGTKVISDFPLFIDGASVTSGVASTTTIGLHTVSETSDSGYTSVIGGNCAANGTITLALGDVKTCTVTNDDIAPVVITSSSGGGGGGGGYPTIPPLIDVVKIPSPLALPNGPGTVNYTYTLRNIGTIPVANITMVGDTCSPIVRISGDTNSNNRLDVTETWVYTCSTALSKTHTNIVTTTGWGWQNGFANGISATDIASATVIVGIPVAPPLIHVTKVPSPLVLSAGGGAVTYMYTVTNPGTAPLSNVSITDDKCTGLPGRIVGHPGDLNKNDLLESNETWKFTCKSNLTNTTTNVATASGSANGLIAKDFAIATVVVEAAVPKLPNTGIGPDEKNTPWNIAIPAGLFVVSIFFYFARRKQTA